MNLNRIWKIEMLGQYGWESSATAFLEDGLYRDAGKEHYAIGSYDSDGKEITIDMTAISHGRIRTLFGTKSARQKIRFEGKISKGVIEGVAKNPKGKFFVSFRATRVADHP